MRKFIAVVLLALALAGGAAFVSTEQSIHGYACENC